METKRGLTLVEVLVAITILCILAGIVAPLIITAHKERERERLLPKLIYTLFQKYLAKDPNEEELLKIMHPLNSRMLNDLAVSAFLERTNPEKSEEHLVYLLKYVECYEQELGLKIADKILGLETPSDKALKKIVERVPERAIIAFPVLLQMTADPSEIGFDCFGDVIRNLPSYRQWAWEMILSNPDQIKKPLDLVFLICSDPNHPKEAVDALFSLRLKPYDYSKLMNHFSSPLRDRTLSEFLATEPNDLEIERVVYDLRRTDMWTNRSSEEFKTRIAEHILDHDPKKYELGLIEKECPYLAEKAQEVRRKIIEKEASDKKADLDTKEGILKEIKRLTDSHF